MVPSTAAISRPKQGMAVQSAVNVMNAAAESDFVQA